MTYMGKNQLSLSGHNKVQRRTFKKNTDFPHWEMTCTAPPWSTSAIMTCMGQINFPYRGIIKYNDVPLKKTPTSPIGE
jgi:hypothetical protein